MEGRIGDQLRKERRERGLELEDVEAATGIRARFLRAIEDEDWEQLPGDFYARAFTRTYATHLGLDPARFALAHRPDRVGETGEGPRVEPRLVPETPSARQSRPWLPIAAALAGLVLLAVIVAVVAALSGGGETKPTSSQPQGRRAGAPSHQQQKPQKAPPPAATSLTLTATAEVWVCLLDGAGKPLINGEILEPGAAMGPFHSRRYSMSFGNGSVELTVDGARAATPESSSPIGLAVDQRGRVSEIPEGERPECA